MSNSGPKTVAGRAAVSQNARTHGIFSREPVVPGVESLEEWEGHREGIISSLAPVGTLEETLAERAARLLWRLARVARFEMYAIDRWQDEVLDNLKFMFQLEAGTTSPEARTNCSPAQIRAIHQQRQQILRLLRRFPELADDAFLSYEEAQQIATVVLEAVNDQEGLELVGEPGEQPEDLPRVRVGTLREGLRQVAKRAGLHLADVWARAAQQAIASAAWQQERYERLEGAIPEWRAFRVIPREQEAGWVMRYEAHLSRELARLLKDFHHLQKQRHEKGERGKGKGEREKAVVSGQSSVVSQATPRPKEEPASTGASGENGAPQPSAPTVYPLDGSPSGTDTPAASPEGTEARNGQTDAEAGSPVTPSEEPEAPEAGVPDPNPSPNESEAPWYLLPGKGWANRGHTAEPSPRHGSNHSHRPRHKGRRM
jgi:hypothetical protein